MVVCEYVFSKLEREGDACGWWFGSGSGCFGFSGEVDVGLDRLCASWKKSSGLECTALVQDSMFLAFGLARGSLCLL